MVDRFALLGLIVALSGWGCRSNVDAPDQSQMGGAGSQSSGKAGEANDGGAAEGGRSGGGKSSSGGVSAVSGSGTGGSTSSGGCFSPVTAGGGGGPPIQCPDVPVGNPAAASALVAVNRLRGQMGLGFACMELVAEINTAAQLHCDYYQQNQGVAGCTEDPHAEVPSCVGFGAEGFAERMTNAGYVGSPRAEVMAFGGNPESAVEEWINSVYHRTPLLSPWNRHLGYGGTEDCDTIDMGEGPPTPDYQRAVYPYSGQRDVPREFDGSREEPMPPEPPSGWPSASPIHVFARDLEVTSHTISINGTCQSIAHQGLPGDDHYVLYANEPFAAQTQYRVRIEGTYGDGQGTFFDWTFTTE